MVHDPRLLISFASPYTSTLPVLFTLRSSALQMPALYEGGSLVYNIPDLDTGVLYYVRVSAVSSVGVSESTLATNNPVAPSQHPDSPADVSAEAIIGDGFELNSRIEVSVKTYWV